MSIATPHQSLTVSIADDVRICVPDDVRLMTTYILLEQEDWFEDEIKFVRGILRDGDQVVDIGANYGAYALAAARRIQPHGKVWAFEPSGTTAGFLGKSIESNGFTNVELIAAAVSDQAGVGKLTANSNSELNALCLDAADPNQAAECVPLVTIDECAARFGWQDISFVKIDVEGHELSVIEGGKRFFAAQTPLVMCEVKAGGELNLDVVDRFGELGYATYRLIPGLNILAPFDRKEPLDGYQLNLFCCPAPRAAVLEQAGHLALRRSDVTMQTGDDLWKSFVQQFPYGRSKEMQDWNSRLEGIADLAEYRGILNAYALSRSMEANASVRIAALENAFLRLSKLLDQNATVARALSFVRIAADLGKRSDAVAMLGRLLAAFQSEQRIEIGEPLVALSSSFERIDPGCTFANWIFASALDSYETLRAFSSYFAPADTANVVSLLRSLGFCSQSMERRLELVQRRASLAEHC